MRARQKNLRIFELEIESENQFITFFEKNRVLLLEYLLVLKGEVTLNIKSYLKQNGFCFIDSSECALRLDSKEIQAKVQKEEQQKSQQVEQKNVQESLVIERTIRSGEEISSENDITIFGRINSGARVIGRKNVIAFGEIDGVVECDGDFMIVKKIAHGNVIFKGELLDKSLFDDGILRRVCIRDGTLEIKEL